MSWDVLPLDGAAAAVVPCLAASHWSDADRKAGMRPIGGEEAATPGPGGLGHKKFIVFFKSFPSTADRDKEGVTEGDSQHQPSSTTHSETCRLGKYSVGFGKVSAQAQLKICLLST